jgi:hypothetical protein
MISALYLVFDPQRTWDKIVREERNIWFVFGYYLLPLMVVSMLPELFFLTKWGRTNPYTGLSTPMPIGKAFKDESLGLAGALLVILVMAWFIQLAFRGSNGRSSYRWSFILIAYTSGPMLLLRTMDGVPGLDPWLVLGAGIFLSLMVLYSGIPRVIQPAPSQALGVFIVASFVMVSLAATNQLETLVLTHYSLPAYDLDNIKLDLPEPPQ